MNENAIHAKWIWTHYESSKDFYNVSIIARRTFDLADADAATIAITADSFYRLKINGRWVCDGPGRSWPAHYKYDRIDVSAYVHSGENKIEVIARHYGIGGFHRIAQQPGLLVQLDAYHKSSIIKTVISDVSWQVADYQPLKKNTPKISVQMEPAEFYDAREFDLLRFEAATEVCDATAGPWKDLHCAEVRPLTKEPVSFQKCLGAHIVSRPQSSWCISGPKLLFPGLIEANRSVLCTFGIVTLVHVEKETLFRIKPLYDFQTMAFYVDGVQSEERVFTLAKGSHLLFGFAKSHMQLHVKDYQFSVASDQPYTLSNPFDAQLYNHWAMIQFDNFKFAVDDLQGQWQLENRPDLQTKCQEYLTAIESLVNRIKTSGDLLKYGGEFHKVMTTEAMFLEDHYVHFMQRTVIGDASKHVQGANHAIANTPDYTTVLPDSEGDIELLYDLGTQTIGFYDFEINGNEGMCVDIYEVENIDAKGQVQYTQQNRNGMSYVCTNGWNRYTSLKRRSGRYVFVTLRNQTQPVYIRNFRMIESVYPVKKTGFFKSSDSALNNLWDISERTLALCTEDTFTDCPLYEQTLWVGDARNESIFAYNIYGEVKVARNCIELAAHSLEKYPMVLCQVPSTWEIIIPVWSFLWVISIWDYYWYTGDKTLLINMWPYIIKNMEGAQQHIDEDGLFKAEYWNFFDWTGLDQNQKKVTHNSMFMVGAIDAALKISHTINKLDKNAWLKQMRVELVNGINLTWDHEQNSYVDSIYDDGELSSSISQHNNFLALLYDVAQQPVLPSVLSNILEPPGKMVKVGSPFAILYLYEALEKIGAEELIIKSIRTNYSAMLDYGATTVWESFPEGTESYEKGAVDNDIFPTRSHCHAWSSVPLYYFGRLILGLKQVIPGGKLFEISPWVNDLDNARGSFSTVKGPITVTWTKKSGKLFIDCEVSDGVSIYFVRNRSHAGLNQIVFNGKEVKKKTISIETLANYDDIKARSIVIKALKKLEKS